jgi:O-antigen ligase
MLAALPLRFPGLPIALGAILSSALVGAALAARTPVGIALLIGLAYLPIVFLDLRVGLALWVPLLFLEGIPAMNMAGKAAGLLIVASWVGLVAARGEEIGRILQPRRYLLATLGLLLVWLTLSLAWAEDPALAADDVWHWWALAVLFLVVMTMVVEPRTLRWVAAAFVAGAVVSVAAGALDGSLTSAIDGGARLEGGSGDPNFLAANLVAGTVLALALAAGTREPLALWALGGAMLVLIAGLVASGSRGGALAAAVAVAASFVVFKGRRGWVVAFSLVAVGISALMLANAPAVWERVTEFDNDNGRSDLWTVAWRMTEDHPVAGVGLNNFRTFAPDYVQQPGALEEVHLVVEVPRFVHNTYLQLLAENGVIGLGLFLGFAFACLRASWLAAERFAAMRERGLELLSRAVIVATVSVMGAAFFLSAAVDKRLWLLLALGPALLAAATRRAASSAQGTAGSTEQVVTASGTRLGPP